MNLDDGKGIYVGESSRSMYERTKEHDADREKRSEESHQIKHWLSSHEELLAPPKFRFKLVRSFKDPLTRQLSEAVRIELRGSEILNSKSEYSRCRVPRLTVDMEGWKSKSETAKVVKESIQMEGDITEQELVMEVLRADAEESLAEREQPKRKENVELGCKAKRRKLDLLEGWGEARESGDDDPAPGILLESKDWTEHVQMDAGKSSQSSLAGWVTVESIPEGAKDEEIIPEDRKNEGAIPKAGKRRVRGKLDKKEIIAMKAQHVNIRTLLAAPPKIREQEDEPPWDILADLEKEERLERVRQRRLEWENNATTPGGPSHQIGVGAPLQQINTRASPHPPSPLPTPL